MDFKDYYKILGVSPQADPKEIKKAYQSLAKKYHPDVNPGQKEAEDKFKEVNEAYHAIADPAKRQKYDDLRADYERWQSRGGRGPYDWSAWQEPAGSTSHTHTMTPEEFAELFGDKGFGSGRSSGGFSDFFSTIFGMGQDYDSQPDNYFSEVGRRPRVGRDLRGEITITLEEAYHGAKKLLDIGNRRIEAVIPKGIQDNKKIRLSGQGEEGSRGNSRGDLLLTVKVLSHNKITRDGNDLIANLDIDFYTAALGGEATVNTLAGDILLKIPPKTQTGKSFRLKGKGMPIINQPGKYGDLYVKATLVLPENITEEEITALQKLRQQRYPVKEE